MIINVFPVEAKHEILADFLLLKTPEGKIRSEKMRAKDELSFVFVLIGVTFGMVVLFSFFSTSMKVELPIENHKLREFSKRFQNQH